MVLEYLPTCARTKSPSFVGKYTSTMEHLGTVIYLHFQLELHPQIEHPPFQSSENNPRFLMVELPVICYTSLLKMAYLSLLIHDLSI